MTPNEAPLLPSLIGDEDVEGAIRTFTRTLRDLEVGHRLLEARAERVEAELSIANAALGQKVEELEAMRRQLESILASLPTGVVVLDPAERVVRANRAALAMLGVPADELLERALPRGLIELPDDGSTSTLERPDGEAWSLSRRRTEVRADDAELLGSLEILEDRRELTRVTDQMHQQAKMAALGTMAGGIAHEVRNPMNAIRGFAALLARRLSGNEEALRFARRIEDGVVEVDSIISSVLAFADPERLCTRTLRRGAELIEAVLDLVRRDLNHLPNPEAWTLESSCTLDSFVGDLVQLRQALRNLVANAVDAQPDGGSVRILLTSDGDSACLFVEDGGSGLDPDLAARVRDPFFTTRADGTGLGLALVDTIARLHGGALEVCAAPSSLGGARIGLRIPLSIPMHHTPSVAAA